MIEMRQEGMNERRMNQRTFADSAVEMASKRAARGKSKAEPETKAVAPQATLAKRMRTKQKRSEDSIVTEDSSSVNLPCERDPKHLRSCQKI